MGRYEVIGILALLILIVVLPVYALLEPYRLNEAQRDLQRQYVAGGTDLYLQNCVSCHGPAGEGVGAMPALNALGRGGADRDILFRTISRSPHGTVMAAWHLEEGGVLTDYQVEGLVTLILDADWGRVRDVADERAALLPTPAASELDIAVMDISAEMDPHECRACHDEPEVHAERFGLNCSRCHTLDAWEPALLLRHTFHLDHGDEGEVACQTCHTRSYAEHTCYECHDHTPEGMQEVHAAEDIDDYENCAVCHPTGVEGEGEQYRNTYQRLALEIVPLPVKTDSQRGGRAHFAYREIVRKDYSAEQGAEYRAAESQGR